MARKVMPAISWQTPAKMATYPQPVIAVASRIMPLSGAPNIIPKFVAMAKKAMAAPERRGSGVVWAINVHMDEQNSPSKIQ